MAAPSAALLLSGPKSGGDIHSLIHFFPPKTDLLGLQLNVISASQTHVITLSLDMVLLSHLHEDIWGEGFYETFFFKVLF